MKYGRKDATGPDMCHPEGNLPAGAAPWPTGGDAAGHLRAVFHRMGLTDQDIVALSGAHCVGRAHPGRSGLCHKPETKYTVASACPVGTGTTGGASWTPEWTKFDNTYFQIVKEPKDEELLALETDTVLFKDPEFEYVLYHAYSLSSVVEFSCCSRLQFMVFYGGFCAVAWKPLWPHVVGLPEILRPDHASADGDLR